MISGPASTLSPKPALRENDVAAKGQVVKQEGEGVKEQPRSVVYSDSRSSSGPSGSSSNSPSMSSSTPSKQPRSTQDAVFDNLYNAVYSNNEEVVKDLLLVSTFIVKSTVFAKSDPSRNSELLYHVLVSMKKEFSPRDFKECAQKLLPHLRYNTRLALETIISA